MSAAEDASYGIDLPREVSSDDFPDAQVNEQPYFRNPEDDIASLHSDGFVHEASSSEASDYQPNLTMSQQLLGSNNRVVPTIASSSHAEEETYFTRPNRYFGPDSTWLSWTKEDRLVAQTLDQLRSQNLSIHIFNAYALKRQGQAAIRQRQRRRKGKERARSPESGSDSEAQQDTNFIPPRTWTAWPLAPNQVPRETELSDLDDYEAYRMAPDSRPSATLEDCVIATTTRLARERWRSRKWASESKIPAPTSLKRVIKVEQGIDVDMNESQQRSADAEGEGAATVSAESESGSEVFESRPWDEDEQPTIETQVVGVKSEADGSDTESERRPTPIADEDAAKSVLLPSTRHLLSKVDDLLIGLHHARQAYATTRPHAPKNEKGDDSEEPVSAESERPNTDTQRPRKRKRSKSSPANTRSDHPSKHPRQSKDPLGLRDWSDVMGMAALTGWDPAVVQRASERCANLFGENMMFRTFFEGETGKKERCSFTEHFAVDDECSASRADVSDEETKMLLTRTSRACKTCRRLKEKCEPGSSEEGIGPCKLCLTYDDNGPCSGITTALCPQPNAASANALCCPDATCDRHTVPFKKRFHLQRHIDSVHRKSSVLRIASSPSRASSSGGEYLSAPANEIVCPILTCPRHERGFSKGSRLYQHISKMHPEVNVDEVKRLEKTRRGDKRGRWRDERRRRPRSRSKSVGAREEAEGDGSDSDE